MSKFNKENSLEVVSYILKQTKAKKISWRRTGAGMHRDTEYYDYKGAMRSYKLFISGVVAGGISHWLDTFRLVIDKDDVIAAVEWRRPEMKELVKLWEEVRKFADNKQSADQRKLKKDILKLARENK